LFGRHAFFNFRRQKFQIRAVLLDVKGEEFYYLKFAPGWRNWYTH
jgi:hypothetical protein